VNIQSRQVTEVSPTLSARKKSSLHRVRPNAHRIRLKSAGCRFSIISSPANIGLSRVRMTYSIRWNVYSSPLCSPPVFHSRFSFLPRSPPTRPHRCPFLYISKPLKVELPSSNPSHSTQTLVWVTFRSFSIGADGAAVKFDRISDCRSLKASCACRSA
jgi:hypothetical protein